MTAIDRTIPLPLISVVAEALKDTHSESKLRGLFSAAGIEVPTTTSSKVELCMACLGWANKHLEDPLTVLGDLIGGLMDQEAAEDDVLAEHQERVKTAMHAHHYTYQRGGQISGSDPLIVAEERRTSITPAAPKPTRPNISKNRPEEVRMSRDPRPTLFIGSTVEALNIARAVHAELDHDLEVTLWNHGLFPGSTMTWSQLLMLSNTFDFALFIFSGDDQVTSRGEDSLAVRDNVLIEYGLFAGALGHDRVFFMFNRDARPKIASDLAGVVPLTYAARSDNNFRAAVSPAAHDIRQAAQRLGRRGSNANP